MIENSCVHNGTSAAVKNEIVNISSLTADSKINVTVYLSDFDKYKTEFNTWSKKTAQATLEMCRVVYEAKKELESQKFLQFCNEIGRKGEDATVRKYLRIGEKYDKFYQYADLLPNSWTSIYEITQLSSEMFEALMTTEYSLANITGEQIKKLMGKSAEDKTKSSGTSAANTTSVPPQTAHTSAVASDVAVDELSQSVEIAPASASSDLPQNDLIDSDAASDEVDLNVAANVSSSDVTPFKSDCELVKQAASTVLEKAAPTVASTSVDLEPRVLVNLFEVLIRFKTIPTDDMWFDLVEEIENIVEKYNFNVDIVETRPEFV